MDLIIFNTTNRLKHIQIMIDIGVNLTSPRFKNVSDVLSRAKNSGIKKMVITGTSLDESKNAISMCESSHNSPNGFLFSTVGIHPHEAKNFSAESLDELKKLTTHSCVVAIGETGLDYYRNFSSKESQIESFTKHIELAIDKNLPLFLHERNAFDDQVRILESFGKDLPKSVIHCFTGGQMNLLKYLEMGLYIGITGWICDINRGKELRNIVKNVPLEKLMVETDAPYLLPQNMSDLPKNKINEPAFLKYVIDEIAVNRCESLDEICSFTSKNATSFFNL